MGIDKEIDDLEKFSFDMSRASMFIDDLVSLTNKHCTAFHTDAMLLVAPLSAYLVLLVNGDYARGMEFTKKAIELAQASISEHGMKL